VTQVSLSPQVVRALKSSVGVVALESTVIAHGLPAPHNLETAQLCEDEVRTAGSEPATIGIVAGRPVIGLENEQIDAIARRDDVVKVSLHNLAEAIACKRWGATTVAATLHLAHLAGLRVFATGGIGGVHRGVADSLDISADLAALSRYPLIVVCSGAKSILDVPKTLEALESMGVPVVGYRTSELPAFYSVRSGLRLEIRADDAASIVKIARAHWDLGFSSAVVVAQAVPPDLEVPAEEMQSTIADALVMTEHVGVRGKDVTPYLLKKVVEVVGARALEANIALLRQNARLAGAIASRLAESGGEG
jgi:pseudouridylate synthase